MASLPAPLSSLNDPCSAATKGPEKWTFYQITSFPEVCCQSLAYLIASGYSLIINMDIGVFPKNSIF